MEQQPPPNNPQASKSLPRKALKAFPENTWFFEELLQKAVD
ncbi:MAG: hypothetical protein ACLQUR_01850 [Limisphaerales bacterium]